MAKDVVNIEPKLSEKGILTLNHTVKEIRPSE